MNAPLSPTAKSAIREASAIAAAALRKSAGADPLPTDIDIARRLREGLAMIDAQLVDMRQLARQSAYGEACARSIEGARNSIGLAHWQITETHATIAAQVAA